MTNTEKNAVVLDCLNEALKKIYPDEKKISKDELEEIFKHYLSQVGLLGLSDLLIDVLVDTLVAAGLVGADFINDDDEDEDEDEPEAAPAPTINEIIGPSVFAESI